MRLHDGGKRLIQTELQDMFVAVSNNIREIIKTELHCGNSPVTMEMLSCIDRTEVQ